MALSTESIAKLVTSAVAVGGLVFTGITFVGTQRREAETRHLQAREPFLRQQLALYSEATRVAARIANPDGEQTEVDRRRFWELYWGELALVEDRQVEAAMVQMGACVKADRCTACGGSLQTCALALAHACRSSLAASWGVEDWVAGSTVEP
jgi:hypothetical protein